MVYTVYIDVVFAVNTIMDVMVLAILNRVLSYRTTKRRLLAGAVIGGIWSCVVSVMPGLPPAVEVLGTYVAVSSLMAVAAYHLKSVREIVKSVAGIYLVSVVLGGVMLMLYEHTKAGYYAWEDTAGRSGFGDTRSGLDFYDDRGCTGLLWLFRGDQGTDPLHGTQKRPVQGHFEIRGERRRGYRAY